MAEDQLCTSIRVTFDGARDITFPRDMTLYLNSDASNDEGAVYSDGSYLLSYETSWRITSDDDESHVYASGGVGALPYVADGGDQWILRYIVGEGGRR